MSAARDPYVAYLRGFFARWSPVYDLFARPIGRAYRAAVEAAGAAPGRDILDVCTGTGEIARRLARRGARVTAVDFTPSMLVRARGKARGGRLRLLEMDARQLGFADRSFDVAVLSFALHDMPSPVRRECLREALRVARDGVVVLDYEPPRAAWGRRLVTGLLATLETAYFRGFVREGGIAGALRAAGLDGRRVSAPVPGLCAVFVVPPPGAAARADRA